MVVMTGLNRRSNLEILPAVGAALGSARALGFKGLGSRG